MNMKNKSGVVLILVLWILVILTTLAVGLGRSTNIELTLTKYSVAKLKAKYLAQAGVFYAMDLLEKDASDNASQSVDTMYLCARPTQDASLEELFEERALEDGHFTLDYWQEPTEEDGEIFTTQIGETHEKKC